MSDRSLPRAAHRSDWMEQRLGVGALMQWLLSDWVNPRWAWLRTTGVACLALVFVECVTGPVLALYYTPSPTAAYKDILAIQGDPIGRFVRGLHHWSSAALILLSAVTVARMFFLAEYKGRRDVVWIAAVFFFQFILLFQITGHILPWDTNAAASASVEAGIASNVWVIGPMAKRFILGSATTGAVTLTRWYGLHTLVLPLIAMLLTGLPLLAHRLRTGEATEKELHGIHLEDNPVVERYYPHHMAREMVVALAVFLIVAALAVFGKTPLEQEATAANLATYKAMSEWYVLPLHSLTLIPPFNNAAFEPLATFVGPLALFGALLALPFVDTNPARRAVKRRFAITAGVATLAGTLGLYGYAFIVERPTVQAERIAVGGTGAPPVVVNTKLAEQGKQIYGQQGCNACHAIGGIGGKAGPELTRAGSRHTDRDWQVQHLIKPDSRVPGSTMPSYGQLRRDDLQALAEYLISLR